MKYTIEELRKQKVADLGAAINMFRQNLKKENVIKEINAECANGYKKSLKLLKEKGDCNFVLIDENEIKELDRLEQEFFYLAMSLIYGGHLVVQYKDEDIYNIYIDGVEFFFHCEGKRRTDELNVKDPVTLFLYDSKRKPKAPMPSIGFHITFDDDDGGYHASALVNAFTVTDGEKNAIAKEQIPNHIFDYLNGVPNSDEIYIKWKDELLAWRKFSPLMVSFRYKVFDSSDEELYKVREYDVKDIGNNRKHYFVKKAKSSLYYKKDLRLWSFRKH